MEKEEIQIKKISKWIIKSQQGELQSSEQEELTAWRNASVEHERLYRRLEDEVYLKEHFMRYRTATDREEWRQIQTMLKGAPGYRQKGIVILRYAALIVLVFTAGYLFRGISHQGKESMEIAGMADIPPGSPKAVLELADGRLIDLSKEREDIRLRQQGIHQEGAGLVYDSSGASVVEKHILRVPPGGEYKLTLEDGTQVWLNSATVLYYPNYFSGDKRCVAVEGEAYFKVAKDKQHPFIVQAGDLTIRVTGTEFNIMAYQEEKKVATTLVRGGVEILSGEKKLVLEPGYQTVYFKENRLFETHKVNTTLYTSWKDGVFEFEDMPLEEICRQLSRWYDVNFRFETPGLAFVRFTGAVKKEKSVGFILDVIGNTKAVTYHIQGKDILLKKK